MKKIPTLFERVFEKHKIIDITNKITPGCEEAFLHGIATIKIDGSCCAIINGVFYKRYDAKKGKKPPEGAIPCCEPDPITGHHPHWVKVDFENPCDKWFKEALYNYCNYLEIEGARNKYRALSFPKDGTYEAIGPHFNGNPEKILFDTLIPHGKATVDVERDFEHVREFLKERYIEGLVFWLNDKPVCKIKRSDFGFPWN